MEQPVGRWSGAATGESRPAAPLSSYVGTYNDYWGPREVTEQDGKLLLALGPRDTFP